MSDTPRKRSRKSKLVPRECVIEHEDVELQCRLFKIPKQMTHKSEVETQQGSYNILKKDLNPAIDNTETVPASSASINFQIKVEIETCDEYSIQVIPLDKDATQKEEVPNSSNSSACQNLEAMVNNAGSSSKRVRRRKYSSLLKTSRTTHSDIDFGDTQPKHLAYTLTDGKILDAAQKIMNEAPTIAEKTLDIALRNMVGHETEGLQYEGVHETKIQKVFDVWRTWQFQSFYRDSPLFYKCYICELSWWYLADFREHIAQHTNLIMDLESYGRHEVNIIAFSLIKPSVRDVFTEGLCGKCGKDYNAHKLSSRVMGKFYTAVGCTSQFDTCIGLRDHIRKCKHCKFDNASHRCVICKNVFDNKEIENHQRLCHCVRSDVPIMSWYTSCVSCNARYNNFSLHICGKRGPHIQCSYCFRNFPNKFSLELHMSTSSELYRCEVCNRVLLWSCQKYEHMLTHTNKYIIVNKCVNCEDFKVFVNTDSALEHMMKEHPQKDVKRQQYFAKIIIPKSCIESEEEECDWSYTPDDENDFKSELVLEPENITIKEEPESVPQIAIKDEPIDVYETQIDYNTTEEEFTAPVKTEIDNITPEFTIKQEYEEEEEYEDDIIKLDIDISEHLMMVKEEPSEETSEFIEASELSQESNDNSQESIDNSRESDDNSTTDGLSSIQIKLNYDSVEVKEEVLPSVIMLGKAKKTYTCSKCGYTARHRDYREHITTGCYKYYAEPKNYGCTKCDVIFSSMKKYLTHLVDHGFKRLCCPECSDQFRCFTKLTPHVHTHIRQGFVKVKVITLNAKHRPDYQCKKCAEIVDIEHFFEHWEKHVVVKPGKYVICNINNVAPKSDPVVGEIKQDEIEELILRLSVRAKQCNYCQRIFNRYNECKRHLIEHLLSDAYVHKFKYGELRCQICGSGFAAVEKYKQHMRDHANLPVYKCELCDKSFSDSSNFTKHKKVHNLRVFVCDLCGKKFQSKMSLAKHFEMHKNSKPIFCEPCDKIFYFESSYRKHVRTCHERIQMGYKCVICGKRFESLKLKWNHMWEVHKERKHKADCPICFKSFRKYSDVRIHAREDHNTEVSVYSVKNQEKSMIPMEKFLKKQKKLRLGKQETLVVYE